MSTATTLPGAMSAAIAAESAHEKPKTDVIDTLQSLIVAFVIAMTFRGFVLEGFMIPTGSMAPTLLGQHVLLHSPVTGYVYTADAQPINVNDKMKIIDPMVTGHPIIGDESGRLLAERAAIGDRVLVLKYLRPFLWPERWDVVVFKSPSDPVGDTQNYIKRLVGLPNETLLLADGDVFTGPPGARVEELHIQRKPEYVQRAVWQPVYDSDYQPNDLERLQEMWRKTWPGPPWRPTDGDAEWSIRDRRVWSYPSAKPTDLAWDFNLQPIHDWNAYNVWRLTADYPVSDIRVAAGMEVTDPAAFRTSLLLRTRGHRLLFSLGGGKAELSITTEEEGKEVTPRISVPFTPNGSFTQVEFWHVDQSMSIFADGREIARLEYDLGPPARRLELAQINMDRYQLDPVSARPQGIAELKWHFEGSPVNLRRVRVDRDLYYQPAIHQQGNQIMTNGDPIHGAAFATDLRSPARLADDQFLMLGDNSAASRDGRLWGRPHPLVVRELGVSTPFIVPRELLIGKAWSVYFPATAPLASGINGPDSSDKLPWISPNFGRLRFIR